MSVEIKRWACAQPCVRFLLPRVTMQSFLLIVQTLQCWCAQSSQYLHELMVIDQLRRMTTFRKRLGHKNGGRKAIALILAVLSLTGALGHRFYNQPQLAIGKVAPETIEAPYDASVEDQQATEKQRERARTDAVTIWKMDATANQQIRQDLQAILDQGSEMRRQVGTIPFTDTKILSDASQRYLRSADAAQVNGLLAASQNPAAKPPPDPLQRQVFEELQTYRRIALDKYPILLAQISHARLQFEVVLNMGNAAGGTDASPNPPTKEIYNAQFLDLPEPIWQKTQTELINASERMLAQGIPPGLPPSQLENAINLQAQVAMPDETKAIAPKLLRLVLKPNLSKDAEQTHLLAEKAALEVKPVLVTARQGQVIVQAGQPITQRDFLLLDYFNLSRRSTNWLGLVCFGVLIGGAVVSFWQIEQRFHPKGLRNRDYWLVWLLMLSTPALAFLNVPSMNLPAIGLLMGTFYGSLLSVTSVGLLSVVLPIGTTISLSQCLPAAVASLITAIGAARLRSREELAFLGVAVGATQGVLYFLIGTATGVFGYSLIGKAVLSGVLGLAWTIVAIGISPYLEHIFDVVTTIRLVELANPNRPLLKRLAAETPGTFQHTLFVANLAEAAARELGCNVELVRAGTLYHDIGKMHDPMGFIENQMGGPNKHDLINDPWVSAGIIKKHVTEGIVMARKARLPKAVQAFIPEHQGTMTIAYFHHQAQQRAKEDPTILLDDADFRYDGPAPQSRETGIVMLADSCEAALRSLSNATPEMALNMINKILAARWKDGQLDESGLTREEMSRIAQVFVQVWQQSNHQRIAYPKLSGK